MAIIMTTKLSSVRLFPENRLVEILMEKLLVEDTTNEVVGVQRGDSKLSYLLKIGQNDDTLRSLLGIEKANLIINNL